MASPWRTKAWSNPGNWYLLVAGALLLTTFLLPWWSARRTARVESRADDITAVLAATLRELGAGGSDDDVFLARCQALATARGVHIADLEPLPTPLPEAWLCLRNKHYLFQVAVSPCPPNAVVDAAALPVFEVTAWPLEASGPGHCAFFYADDAPRAYTRNKSRNYHGTGPQRLRPGHSHRQTGPGFDWPRSYRSRDDERWLLH
jgi:hypothetical protein